MWAPLTRCFQLVSQFAEIDQILPIAAKALEPKRSITPVDDELPLTVIEPKSGWQIIDFRELWRYREVLYCLTWRDVMVRYKQTVLGIAWALLQPLAAMLVFAVFLGRLGGLGG